MLLAFAVRPQGDHAPEVTLVDVAGKAGLLRGLLVIFAVVVREPVLLLVKRSKGS